jgi:hypothetical protein
MARSLFAVLGAIALVTGSMGENAQAVTVVAGDFGCGPCNVNIDNPTQTSTTVTGTTGNGLHVSYSTVAGITLHAQGGQATIEKNGGGLFTDLFWVASQSYTHETIALGLDDGHNGSPISGLMQLKVFTNLLPAGQLFNLAVSENGENKFELTAGVNEGITKVAILGFSGDPSGVTALAISTFKQDRIDGLVTCDGNVCHSNGPPPPGAPLPGALFLMGSVIAGGIGFGAWRRKKNAAA